MTQTSGYDSLNRNVSSLVRKVTRDAADVTSGLEIINNARFYDRSPSNLVNAHVWRNSGISSLRCGVFFSIREAQRYRAGGSDCVQVVAAEALVIRSRRSGSDRMPTAVRQRLTSFQASLDKTRRVRCIWPDRLIGNYAPRDANRFGRQDSEDTSKRCIYATCRAAKIHR